MTELPDYMRRHVALYEARGDPYTLCGGRIYRPYAGAIRPYGPIKQDYTLGRSDATGVMGRLGRPILLCTDGIDTQSGGDWYAVICRRFTPIEECDAKHRSEIRRGLKSCEVRRVDADFLIRHGYPVYLKAHERYRGRSRPGWNESAFQRHFESSRPFDDIVHCWGVFRDGRMITFGVVNVFGRIEATYWMIKTDPDSLPHYPVYALLHTMNGHYLGDGQFEYVNDGWRAIIHETGIQDFLCRKFGFQRAHSRLQVTYRPWLALGVGSVYPLRGCLGRLSSRLEALFEIERIRRICRHGTAEASA